jgi:hypothetical protein
MKRIASITMLLLVLSTIALSQVWWNRVEFRRVPNLTAYSAGDVVGPDTVAGTGNLLCFSGIVPNGSYGGVIAGLKLTVDTANVTNASFKIYFYSDSAGNKRPLDNAAFVRTMKEDSLIFGSVTLNPLNVTGTGSGTTTAEIDTALAAPIPVRTVAGSRTIYARIVALAAWAPPRAQRIRLELYLKAN